jgi:hypothetical protein
MPNTLSPNMSLILPTIGQEPGPNWAQDLNNSLSLLDQHNHAPGSGIQITPAGLDINSDLTFNGNNAVNLKSTRFISQISPLASGSDIGCVYVSGADLYYNDTLGNQVRLTISGAVNGTPGSIGGLVAPATVTYVPANQAYVFQSNVNTSGSIDAGPITFRNNTSLSNGITLAPPSPLPGNYTITFPASTPASQKILTLDAAGNLAANYDVDNSTLTIASNTIKVANSGITQTQLANDSVGTNQIIDGNVTASKLANTPIIGTSQIVDGSVTPIKRTYAPYNIYNIPSNTFNIVGSTTATLASTTFTTSSNNKLVCVNLVPSAAGSYLGMTSRNALNAGQCFVYTAFNGNWVGGITSRLGTSGSSPVSPAVTLTTPDNPAFSGVIFVSTAGTYTVNVFYGVGTFMGNETIVINGYKLEIYELG